ncbi:MAG: TM2 domain-containing protein [Coriobacteriales bacterium]|jgi:hypothetical protein|nr:TM2 domain-containing protein [Coriobacteriales bacterium]
MPICSKCGGVSEGRVFGFRRTPFIDNDPQTVNITIHNNYGAPPPSSADSTPIPPSSTDSTSTPSKVETSASAAPTVSTKSWWVALILCVFLGLFGAHRFYVGKIGTGIIWLLTVGFFAIGWIADIVFLCLSKFTDKQDRPIVGSMSSKRAK